ncbi:MAG TPA: DUF4147 domain-containing protein, partial [bacterium]|nr:DUF4147 domain-containing protein [bacterium]
EAGHPLPDENSIKYTKELLALVDKANSDDLVIVLISGGGSALLALPVDESISLDDKQKLTKLLLNCGAEITEINSIRKFISAVKSGKLSQRIAPADSIALIISDVIGDRIDIIASGPTADYFETNAEDCLEILKKYNLLNTTPKSIKNFITKNISKKPLRKCEYKKTDNFLILNNFRVLRAAAEISKKIGYIPLILSSSINGETREIAKMHIAIADEIIKNKQRRKKPICLISGGETTVTVKGSGLGGRNQEFVLAALIEIYKRQLSNIAVASVGTDGTDGPTDAAGAWCCAGDYEKAINVGLNPQKCLDDNDSYNFFKSINNLIITGPTGTNIMDLRMILIK